MDITQLESKKINELRDIARDMGVSGYSNLKKQDLIFNILREKAKTQGNEFRGGVLEIVEDDKQMMGFLRSRNYLPGPDDIYVSSSQIRRLGLRTGDMTLGQVRVPKDNEKYYSLLRVEAVNGADPELAKSRPSFGRLTPIFPEEKLKLEREPNVLSTRMLDLVAPDRSRSKGFDCVAAKGR